MPRQEISFTPRLLTAERVAKMLDIPLGAVEHLPIAAKRIGEDRVYDTLSFGALEKREIRKAVTRFDMLTRAGKDWIRTSIPAAVVRDVLARCGKVCAYCGSRSGPFHLDHIHPVSKGGTNDPENLTVACASCNSSKGNKTLDDWDRVRRWRNYIGISHGGHDENDDRD